MRQVIGEQDMFKEAHDQTISKCDEARLWQNCLQSSLNVVMKQLDASEEHRVSTLDTCELSLWGERTLASATLEEEKAASTSALEVQKKDYKSEAATYAAKIRGCIFASGMRHMWCMCNLTDSSFAFVYFLPTKEMWNIWKCDGLPSKPPYMGESDDDDASSD